MKKTASIPKIEFNLKQFTIDVLVTIIGTFIFAVAVHTFTLSNQIAPGGVTGLSTIINFLTGLPFGAIAITLNIPIMIVGLIFLGRWIMLKTLISIITFTISMDYILVYAPEYTGNVIVAALFGGVLMGIGIGMTLAKASSTGGTDIVIRIIGKKLPHIKLGTITFCIDIVIIIISGFVYGSIEPVLFAIITLYTSARVLDAMLYGFNVCQLMYIVSDKSEDISLCIMTQMNRGATILDSYGAYSKQKKPTIMCAVRRNQYTKLKRYINAIDPGAFIIITSANEIVGSGFKSSDSWL